MKKDEKDLLIEDLKGKSEEEIEIRKTPLPKENQVIGIVESRLGGPRMKVKCLDGETRIGRVPGRLKRKLWVREGDYVLCELWEFQKDRCEIIYKYSKTQVNHLKEKGIIKEVEDSSFEEEF